MKKTYHIRVSEEWHDYAKKAALETSKSISEITEEALMMHSGEYKRLNDETEANFKAMFPDHTNHKTSEMTPKTPHFEKLSTDLANDFAGLLKRSERIMFAKRRYERRK